MKISNITIEMQDFDDEAPTREYPRCDVCGALMTSRCSTCIDTLWILKAAAIKEPHAGI
jgi:hypothetical protein